MLSVIWLQLQLELIDDQHSELVGLEHFLNNTN
jgi:hypothetical protein